MFCVTEYGSCSCWGDPHCLSFDKKWLHFQGACQYTLARDGCEGGVNVSAPTFEVIQNNWKGKVAKPGVYSWTKEIYVLIYGHVS